MLAERLVQYADRAADVLVLALPRGGVPVAFEVAHRLHAPLDVFVVRKLGTPGQPELAMGAIASGPVRILNEQVIEGLQLPRTVIEEVTVDELEELHRRERLYRGDRTAPDVAGKIVLLVDDGIATGSTMRSAIKALRSQNPSKLVVAVPTIAKETFEELQGEVDELVALLVPENFCAVGQWYMNFNQTTDEEVAELLARSRSVG